MSKKKLVLAALAIIILLVIAFSVSATNTKSDPAFVASFAQSPHKSFGATCQDCHPDQGGFVNSLKAATSKLFGSAKNKDIVPNSQCLNCHSGKSGIKLAGKDVTKFSGDIGKIHSNTKLKCADCHIQSTHGDKNITYKLAIVESDKCLACHVDEGKIATMSTPLPPATTAGQG